MPNHENSGLFLHASYTFMPNSLGFCGPDDRGSILRHLQTRKEDEKLFSTLKDFEAAYPFIRMIGEANRKNPFDAKVTEAYWIGNELLRKVPKARFYSFALNELSKAKPGIKSNGGEIRALFRNSRFHAIPHHTFYVINTATNVLSGKHYSSAEGAKKLGEIMDNCRISWGKVVKVQKDGLVVRYQPLLIKENSLRLGGHSLKEVKYDPEIIPFNSVKEGDSVSMHWNFACQILSKNQLINIKEFTAEDIESGNLILRTLRRES
jgi:hypothetical protein